MILAIETSGTVCGAALHDGNAIVALREDDRSRIHDAALSTQVRGVLDDAGISFADVTGVACSIGPGSFTGLRIGLSMAKGLCFSTGTKIIPVPTLDALAFAARDIARAQRKERIITAIAAEGDKSYFCVYDMDGNRLEEYRTLRRGDLPPVDAGALVIGTASLYFTHWGTDTVAEITSPRVRYVADLGSVLFSKGIVADPSGVEPLYVTQVNHATL